MILGTIGTQVVEINVVNFIILEVVAYFVVAVIGVALSVCAATFVAIIKGICE